MSCTLNENTSFESMYSDVNLHLDLSIIEDDDSSLEESDSSMDDDDSELSSEKSTSDVISIPFDKIVSDIDATMNNAELNYEQSLGGLMKLIVTNKALRDCFVDQTLDHAFLNTIFHATSPNTFEFLGDEAKLYDSHLKSINRNIEPQASVIPNETPEKNTNNMNGLFYNNASIKDVEPTDVIENDQPYCF